MGIVLMVFLGALGLGLALFGILVIHLFQWQMRPFSDEYYEQWRKDNEIFAGLIERHEKE